MLGIPALGFRVDEVALGEKKEKEEGLGWTHWLREERRDDWG